MIIELLGPEELGLLAADGVARIQDGVKRRNLAHDERATDFFAANCLELAVFEQAMGEPVALPVACEDALVRRVEYKCNTFSTMLCDPHVGRSDRDPVYAFFFVSDFWKLQRTLKSANLLRALADHPDTIREHVQQWDLAATDRHGQALDITVLLWSAKAHLLLRDDAAATRGILDHYCRARGLGVPAAGLDKAFY